MERIRRALQHAFPSFFEMCLPMPAKSLSPCVGLCRLDARDLCLGCGRTMAEIRSWGLLTRGQQRKILTRIHLRRRATAAPLSSSSQESSP